jgi:hypothetical protein
VNLPTEGKPRADRGQREHHAGAQRHLVGSGTLGRGSLLEDPPRQSGARRSLVHVSTLGAPGAQQWLLGSGAWVGNGFQSTRCSRPKARLRRRLRSERRRAHALGHAERRARRRARCGRPVSLLAPHALRRAGDVRQAASRPSISSPR